MARLFYQTCPGDWDRGQMVGFGGTLRAYYELDELKERAPIFAAMIRFRWEMGLLTDYIISMFKLPMPSGRICILWYCFAWRRAIKGTDLSWEQRNDSIRKALGDRFTLLPREDQGPFFYRPQSYLIAALVEANKADDETMAIITAIGHFVQDLKDFNQQRACQDEDVRRHGREWLKSIGRRAIRSLSPRKRFPVRSRGSEVLD